MRIVYFSDSHNRHEELVIPYGDVLIFGGDMSREGTPEECIKFLKWFFRQPHQYKIFIAGNHDLAFDPNKTSMNEELKEVLDYYLSYDALNFYLNDSGCEIEGVSFWGSPYSPDFKPHKWAFNCSRDTIYAEHWSKIDSNNILITHCPPMYRRDLVGKAHVGCDDLNIALNFTVPDLHLFGHIHEGYGMDFSKYTAFLNGAVCNHGTRELNPVFTIDYDQYKRTLQVYQDQEAIPPF